MAITLLSRPTTPNVVNTKLLFEVSASNSSLPQFSYVMDIYESGSYGTLLSRAFCIPNDEGIAQFQPSQVLMSLLDYDNYWNITGSKAPTNAVKTFSFVFGEAYGTSPSSSVTVIPGHTEYFLEVFPGTLDPNTGYNFDTGSFYTNQGQYLSDDVGIQVEPGWDYGVLLNKNDYYTVTQLKDVSNNEIEVSGYYRNNDASVFVTSSKITFPGEGDFYTLGIGPKNLSEYDSFWSSSIASGDINAITTGDDQGIIRMYIVDSFPYTNGGPDTQFRIPCADPYTRFAFVNKYGFYDYYNVYNPLKRETTNEKQIVSLPKVDYSSAISTYSIENGGDKEYYTDTIDEYSIDTDYIDQQTANWLEELLESPEVFVQQGSAFVPVVVTNTDYEHNNSTSRNKLFKYTINFKPSNGREIVESQPNVVYIIYKTVQFDVTSTAILDSEPTLTMTGGISDTITLSGYPVGNSGSASDSDSYKSVSGNIVFTGSYNPSTSSYGPGVIVVVSQSILLDEVNQETAYTELGALGSTPIEVTQSYTPAGNWDKLTIETDIKSMALDTDTLRISTVNLVCVDSQFLDITSSKEVVRRIEYSHVPQIPYQTGSFYTYPGEGLEIGVRLRDENNNYVTASGYVVGNDLRVGVPITKDRIKDKLWSITTGSLYTLDNGTITAIEDLSTIVDDLEPLVAVPALDGDYYNKISENYPGFSAYDTDKKAKFNFNAYDSYSPTGMYYGDPGNSNIYVLTGGPNPDIFFGSKRVWFRHLLQNSPQATRKRDTLAYTNQTACVNTSGYSGNFDTITYPGWVNNWSDQSTLHWVWRGYQYVGQTTQDRPTQHMTVTEACAYSGSFTNTLFVSGALEPGKRVYNAPSETTTGVELSGGWGQSSGTGSNDYFPVLTPDGVKAMLYWYNTPNTSQNQILEIKNADGTNYTGSVVQRWEGPYFWRGPMYQYQAQAKNDISVPSHTTESIYMDPYRSIEDIDTGDTVYTSFDLNTGTASSPFNGQSYYTKLYDYNPAATSPISLENDIQYVYQISSSGEIIDRTHVNDVITYYTRFVRCIDGAEFRHPDPTYTFDPPQDTQFRNCGTNGSLYYIISGSVTGSLTTITPENMNVSGCYVYPTGSSTSQSLFMQDNFRFSDTGYTHTTTEPFDHNVSRVNVYADTILVAGMFNTIDGNTHLKYAKMNLSGSIDSNFDAYYNSGYDKGRGFLYDSARDYYITYGQQNTAVSSTSASLQIMDNTGTVLFDADDYQSGASNFYGAEVMGDYLYITQAGQTLTRVNLNTLTNDTGWNGLASSQWTNKLKTITDGSGHIYSNPPLTAENLYKRDVTSLAVPLQVYDDFYGGDIYGIIESGSKAFIYGTFDQVNDGSAYYPKGLCAFNNATSGYNATFDTSWNYPTGSIGTVYDVKIQSDGKIIVAGDLTPENFIGTYGCATGNIVRLNSDGTYDHTFMAPTVTGGPVSSIHILDDDSIVAVGDFTTYYYNPLQSGSLAGLGFVVLDNDGNISEYQ